ncbi:CorA family divalent cation transporter [Achromobacter xylosoxidans]|uniref:CorA family divalent cation transporter n=1 Tax=Alcaligenes xylosoxydans xylosoxydans TaxID=85698 RepID=UPI000B48B30D|nr:CorA family divalent cation transporter [Achromobacter xylosoxidans]
METAQNSPGFLFLKRLKSGSAWLHMCIRHRETASYLMDEVALEDLVVEALVKEDTRSRMRARDGGIMVLLKVMRPQGDGAARPEDMVSIRLWITANTIVSTREADVDPIMEIAARLDAGSGPATPGTFLADLVDVHLNQIEQQIERLEDDTDRIAALAAAHKLEAVCNPMAETTMRISGFLRHLGPQRAVLETLCAQGDTVLDDRDRMRLDDSLDRLLRFLETLQSLRERIDILNTQVTRIQDRRLSKSSHTLVAVATIFLPLGFLTGLFGVNLAGIPMATDTLGFWVLAAVCAILAGLLMAFLRWKKML